MSNEKKSTKSFLLGFLAGGAIGAIVALLYAPKSGKEMREDLREKKPRIYCKKRMNFLNWLKIKPLI